MAVVTISRQYGSSGGDIARKVAADLGWKLIGKHDIGRILGEYGLVDFDRDYESRLGFWATMDNRLKTMVTMMNRVMLAVARAGNVVILGRGAFAVLGGYADVLNVRVQAPIRSRIDRLLAEGRASGFDKAQATLRSGDEVRRVFVETMYGLRWDDPACYDLIVDTGKIRPEDAAAMIEEAVKAIQRAMVPGLKVTREIPRDEDIEQSISRL